MILNVNHIFLVVLYGQLETRELYLTTKMICLCIISYDEQVAAYKFSSNG
jgi:hypothetical protein